MRRSDTAGVGVDIAHVGRRGKSLSRERRHLDSPVGDDRRRRRGGRCEKAWQGPLPVNAPNRLACRRRPKSAWECWQKKAWQGPSKMMHQPVAPIRDGRWRPGGRRCREASQGPLSQRQHLGAPTGDGRRRKSRIDVRWRGGSPYTKIQHPAAPVRDDQRRRGRCEKAWQQPLPDNAPKR